MTAPLPAGREMLREKLERILAFTCTLADLREDRATAAAEARGLNPPAARYFARQESAQWIASRLDAVAEYLAQQIAQENAGLGDPPQ